MANASREGVLVARTLREQANRAVASVLRRYKVEPDGSSIYLISAKELAHLGFSVETSDGTVVRYEPIADRNRAGHFVLDGAIYVGEVRVDGNRFDPAASLHRITCSARSESRGTLATHSAEVQRKWAGAARQAMADGAEAIDRGRQPRATGLSIGSACF